jgi:hypothetical protein
VQTEKGTIYNEMKFKSIFLKAKNPSERKGKKNFMNFLMLGDFLCSPKADTKKKSLISFAFFVQEKRIVKATNKKKIFFCA